MNLFFKRKLRNKFYRIINKIYERFVDFCLPKYTIGKEFENYGALTQYMKHHRLSFTPVWEKIHIDSKVKRHKQIREEFRSSNTVIETRFQFLTALISFCRRDISILDFGGGFSSIHFPLLAMQFNRKIHTTIYEPFPEVVEANRLIHKEYNDIKFTSTIPEKTFDIIYWGSSIQYVMCEEEIIEASKRAQYLVITYSPVVTSGKTFFTLSVPHNNTLVPIRIWNVDELTKLFLDNGFEIVNRRICKENWNFGLNNYKNLTADLMFRNTNFDNKVDVFHDSI
tara:strand:- start:666 stop:1511 length:846 start_codon:yes stop_codon:yes gene_type:complete